MNLRLTKPRDFSEKKPRIALFAQIYGNKKSPSYEELS
jgi:hypothetical protein